MKRIKRKPAEIKKLLKAIKGLDIKDASKQLGVAEGTIVNWKARFKNGAKVKVVKELKQPKQSPKIKTIIKDVQNKLLKLEKLLAA